LERLARATEPVGPVIRSYRGSHFKANSVVNWFVVLFKELGFEGCSSHSGRRSFITLANCGNGFRKEDVDAIANLATSAKEIGEGIGNKGLGFRSIEALTRDVHIYSRSRVAQEIDEFDGYCFRFASRDEVYD